MVPHDWSVELPFSKDCSSGTGYLAGGIGWYRVRFALPEELKGKRVRLAFDGVYKNSQVWCNSYYLGKRPNGYVSFSYDISDFVSFGEPENEVSVKVVHTDLADSRWFTGSGITRRVTVIIEEPVHPVEYGTVFHTEELVWEKETCTQAKLLLTHEAVNQSKEETELQIETLFFNQDDSTAARCQTRTVLAAGETKRMELRCVLEQPQLWSTEHPALYRMVTRYRTSEENAYIVSEEKVGIRTIAFDPQEGFFLNGRAEKLKGVCVHHDGGCLGAAMQQEIWQRRLQLLKDCGCNAIRCSHNPHMPELYALCDAMGFFVMDEAFDEWENAKNKWSTGHNVYPPKHQGYYEDFPEWHEKDLLAMVRRDRNHPSVILWSIGNEIDYPNDPYANPMFGIMTGNNDASKPERERQYDFNKPDMVRLTALAAELAGIIRKEDSTHPVTVAAAYPELSSHLGFLDALGVVGYNYKEHLYEEDHKRFPDKAFLGSENGHGYQAWRAVTDHSYICGQFLWTGIDYLGEAHGWPIHGSGAGIITTAGFVKPEYYRRKTYWSSEPGMSLATRQETGKEKSWFPMSSSWNFEKGSRVLVKCYAECREEGGSVVLACNGTEVSRAGFDTEEGAYQFVIDYEPGVLEASCCNQAGEVLQTCQLVTAGQAAELDCQLWQEKDVLTAQEWETASQRTGYLYQVLLSLKDEQGRKVVWDDRYVRAQVQGAGILAGLDNGNLADVTPFSSAVRKTYRGDMAVYVRRTLPGSIRLTLELTEHENSTEGRSYQLQLG